MTRLLLVDDESSVCEEFSAYLQRKGFEVQTRGDGLEAIRAFRRRPPDLVLADYMMPGMNGAELLRELRAIDEGVPVILMSGAADMRSAVHALKENAFDFLRKPVDSRDLMETLNAALERRRERMQEQEGDSGARMYGPITCVRAPGRPDVAMLYFAGPVDDRASKRFEKAFNKLIDDGVLGKQAILVFKNVTYINNMGFNYLTDLARRLEELRIRFASIQLSDKMYQYLSLLGYLEHFRVMRDMGEALDYLDRADRSALR